MSDKYKEASPASQFVIRPNSKRRVNSVKELNRLLGRIDELEAKLEELEAELKSAIKSMDSWGLLAADDLEKALENSDER